MKHLPAVICLSVPSVDIKNVFVVFLNVDVSQLIRVNYNDD